MKKTVLSLCLAVAVSLGAGAQTVDTLGMGRYVDEIITATDLYGNMREQIYTNLKPLQHSVGLTDEQLPVFCARVVDRIKPRVKEAVVVTYAKYLTQDEAKQLVAFYHTRTGAKFAKYLVKSSAEAMTAMTAKQPMLTEVMKAYLNGHRQTTPTENLADDYAREVENLCAAMDVDELFRHGLLIGFQQQANIPQKQHEPMADYITRRVHPAIVNCYADVYRKYFTVEDIRSYAVFFRQPIGRKITNLTEDLTSGLFGSMAGIQQDVVEVLKEMLK